MQSLNVSLAQDNSPESPSSPRADLLNLSLDHQNITSLLNAPDSARLWTEQFESLYAKLNQSIKKKKGPAERAVQLSDFQGYIRNISTQLGFLQKQKRLGGVSLGLGEE